MIRKLITLMCLLIIFWTNAQTTWYATAEAGGGGSGTMGSPWTLSQATAGVSCGDTLYIQAGNYGTGTYTFNETCTSGTRLVIIGTGASWAPIIPTTQASNYDGTIVQRATYTRTDTFSSSDMPSLNSGLVLGGNGTGNGLTILGAYINLKNFSIQGYSKGLYVSGNNHIVENINTRLHGTHSDPNVCCEGRGLDIVSTNSSFKNIYTRDSSHIGIASSGDGNDFENVEVYTSSIPSGNSTDYQLLVNSDNGTYTEINIIREIGTDHLSHGFVSKPQSGDAKFNVLDRFYIENSKIEMQGLGAEYNTMRNGLIVNKAPDFATDYYATSINIINGAHNHTFENIALWRPTWAIHYENWNEVYTNDGPIAGNDNTYRNIISINPWAAHFGFNERDGNTNTTPVNENYYHVTFIGGSFADNNNMTGGTTGGMYNSIVTSSSMGDASSRFASSYVFDKINTPLNLTAYTDSNITNHSFSFTDAMSSSSENISNFNYRPTTSILEIGSDRSANAPLDWNGATRDFEYTLGSVEFETGEILPIVSSTNSILTARRAIFN